MLPHFLHTPWQQRLKIPSTLMTGKTFDRLREDQHDSARFVPNISLCLASIRLALNQFG